MAPLGGIFRPEPNLQTCKNGTWYRRRNRTLTPRFHSFCELSTTLLGIPQPPPSQQRATQWTPHPQPPPPTTTPPPTNSQHVSTAHPSSKPIKSPLTNTPSDVGHKNLVSHATLIKSYLLFSVPTHSKSYTTLPRFVSLSVHSKHYAAGLISTTHPSPLKQKIFLSPNGIIPSPPTTKDLFLIPRNSATVCQHDRTQRPSSTDQHSI